MSGFEPENRPDLLELCSIVTVGPNGEITLPEPFISIAWLHVGNCLQVTRPDSLPGLYLRPAPIRTRPPVEKPR